MNYWVASYSVQCMANASCSWILCLSWYKVVGPLELELGQKDENDHYDETYSGSKHKCLHIAYYVNVLHTYTSLLTIMYSLRMYILILELTKVTMTGIRTLRRYCLKSEA